MFENKLEKDVISPNRSWDSGAVTWCQFDAKTGRSWNDVSQKRWAAGLKMTRLAQFQAFHGQLLQYVKNLSTNSRALSILHSKSHDMVRCGPANRSGGFEGGTNRRRGWGRAPTSGWAVILPAEANLITAFTKLDLLHPAKIVTVYVIQQS